MLISSWIFQQTGAKSFIFYWFSVRSQLQICGWVPEITDDYTCCNYRALRESGGLFFHHFFEWSDTCLSPGWIQCIIPPGLFIQPHSHFPRHRERHEWGGCEWVTDALGPAENQLCVHSASAAPELKFTSWHLRERNWLLSGRSVMCVWVFRFLSSFENFTGISFHFLHKMKHFSEFWAWSWRSSGFAWWK